jgi:hypothetical protein
VWWNRTTCQPPCLIMTTGLQPATGNTLRILKHTTYLWFSNTRQRDARALVCFRIPSISRRYDRVSTLPRSLTNAFSPHVHVSCPPICYLL